MKPFDSDGNFAPVVGGSGLRRLAVRAAGVTVLAQTVGFAVQMIATVVLARLLTPADFGLVTMVTTFSLLLMNCGLNGLTEAVLQRETIDRDIASTLFWINVGLGVALTIAFASAGPLLARFYGDPRIAPVAVAVSATIFLTSVSVQHLALVKRAMRFSAVCANDLVARAVSVAVSIALGWAGWGYWALVAGVVALPLSTSIGAWTLCRWMPGRPRRSEAIGPMMRFATNTYGRFVMDYWTRNLDNVLVGWRFGPPALGFYKKAYDLFILSANQLSSPLTSVAVAALSRVAHDPPQYRRYFLNALATLAFVGMAVGADLTLVGRDLTRLLLGPGWDAAGRIFTFFGPGIGIMLLYYTHGWLHLSVGRADRWLRWAVVELTVTSLLFVAALPWGPAGIAAAWVASFWVLTLPALSYAGAPIRLDAGVVVETVWRYVVASAVAGVATAAIAARTPALATLSEVGGILVRILITSTAFTVLYIGMVILLHRGCEPIRLVARLLRDMVMPARQASACPAPGNTLSPA